MSILLFNVEFARFKRNVVLFIATFFGCPRSIADTVVSCDYIIPFESLFVICVDVACLQFSPDVNFITGAS